MIFVALRYISHCGQPSWQEEDSHRHSILDGTRGELSSLHEVETEFVLFKQIKSLSALYNEALPYSY